MSLLLLINDTNKLIYNFLKVLKAQVNAVHRWPMDDEPAGQAFCMVRQTISCISNKELNVDDWLITYLSHTG